MVFWVALTAGHPGRSASEWERRRHVLDAPLDLLDLLDQPVDTRELTAQMGETSQREPVETQWSLDGVWMESGWSLGGHVVDVRRRSTLTEPALRQPFEAIYFIVFDEQDERYVMQPLDTFGARYPRVLGVGERQGNRISFLFEYPNSPAPTPSPSILTRRNGPSPPTACAGQSERPFASDDLAPLPGDR